MKIRSAFTLPLGFALCLLSCSEGQKNDATKKDGQPPAAETDKPVVAQPRAAFDTLKDGEFTMRYDNGVIRMKGYYMNGKREGEWASFFPSGKLQSEGFFTQGRRDHKATVYYEDGKKMYEGQYKDGVMVGKWTYYNPDGKQSQIVDYDKKK